MATPCVFQRSVLLDAPADAVFRLHEDPRNIRVISPPFLDAKILRAGSSARVGEEFEIQLRVFGFPLGRWVGVWREVVPDRLLMDAGLRCPFAFFQHRHEFAPVDGSGAGGRPQTRMTDHVTYQLAGGWLGKLVGETALRLQLVLAFADRHRRTRKWAAGLVAPPATDRPASG